MKDQKNGAVENAEGKSNVWTIGAGMLVAGLVIGFLVGWAWQKNSSEATASDDNQPATSTEALASSTVPAPALVYQTVNASATVSVDDQRAGSLVFIKHTDVSGPTWIAIREMSNGMVGNIIGAGLVASATDDVPVTLLRPTKIGGQYAVFLYQDDGDGQFDFKKDLLVMQNSAPVAATFTAQ